MYGEREKGERKTLPLIFPTPTLSVISSLILSTLLFSLEWNCARFGFPQFETVYTLVFLSLTLATLCCPQTDTLNALFFLSLFFHTLVFSRLTLFTLWCFYILVLSTLRFPTTSTVRTSLLPEQKASIHFLTQSDDPISCYGKPMQRTNETKG